MRPILLSLGKINIYSYGTMIAIGIIDFFNNTEDIPNGG